MTFEHAAFTHTGRRPHNEDAHRVEPELGLFVVADGMGGYEGGEVASRLVVDTLADFFRRNAGDDEATWPFGFDRALGPDENLLDAGVRLAHREVARRRVGKLGRMGSTVAAVAVRGDRAILGHVGDSRIYRLRDGQLEQLTRDHSLYAELEAAGTPGLPPREAYPHANVITRAIGLGEDERPALRSESLRVGDVFLLCTDGLYETLGAHDLAHMLAAPTVAEACRRIVEEAYARGGRDNITALVLRVRD